MPSCAMVMDTAWSKCTCCNRCATYCPFGIDMGVMFGYVRGLCFSQGFVPWELKIGSGMHRIYRAQMDVTTEDWVDTCEWMARSMKRTGRGLEFPIDKENADIIYTVNAREPKHYPEDLAEAAFSFTWPARTGPFPARVGKRPAWPCLPVTGGPARCRWKASMRPWTVSSPNAWW
jgi:ferredoxin